jgi:hypothetical protein
MKLDWWWRWTMEGKTVGGMYNRLATSGRNGWHKEGGKNEIKMKTKPLLVT